MARILIVDDAAFDRELLRAHLEPMGHQVIEADSGQAALRHAAVTPPDLVLVDLTMPGMNGFQTVAKLKAEAATFLPVMIVTAVNDPSSRHLALRLGADEYLVKPLDRWELAARVTNLLRLRDKERALEERNRQLIELERFRDEMAALIVHDLKNPLSVVISNLEFTLDEPGNLSPDQREAIEDARRGGHRAIRLLHNLLDLTRLEGDRLVLDRRDLALVGVVHPLLEQRKHVYRSRGLTVETDLGEIGVSADSDLLIRVIENILDNALRYTPAGGRIAIWAAMRGDTVELRIGNSGEPVAAAARSRIFEKFGQAEGSQRTNLGLGLYFCRLVIEAHGGQLLIEDSPELPTIFKITFPIRDGAAAATDLHWAGGEATIVETARPE